MDPLLTFAEARVLGCLLEKEMATPDYYPMTAHALVAACNQTTNRDPVVAFEESVIEEALAGLRRKRLAAMLHLAGSRAPKYKHLTPEFFPGLHRPELAVLAVLLLRGPQTAAELRARTDRLHAFPDGEALEVSLRRMMDYQGSPLVAHQPPGGGRRAATYQPLLCAESIAASPPDGTPHSPAAAVPLVLVADWRTTMEAEMTVLRDRIASLEAALGVTAPPG